HVAVADGRGAQARRQRGHRGLGDAPRAPDHRPGLARAAARLPPPARVRRRGRGAAPLDATALLREAPVRARAPGRTGAGRAPSALRRAAERRAEGDAERHRLSRRRRPGLLLVRVPTRVGVRGAAAWVPARALRQCVVHATGGRIAPARALERGPEADRGRDPRGDERRRLRAGSGRRQDPRSVIDGDAGKAGITSLVGIASDALDGDAGKAGITSLVGIASDALGYFWVAVPSIVFGSEPEPPTEMEIFCGLACTGFATCTSSTPSLNEAWTSFSVTPCGRPMVRVNVPKRRSNRK